MWQGGQANLENVSKDDSPVKLFFEVFPVLCDCGRNSPRIPYENSFGKV